MAEQAPVTDLPSMQNTPDVQSTDPPQEQDAIEKPKPEKQPVEVVADPRYILWKYPPYCELCSVHFSGESNSQKHFDGTSHTNKLATWRKYRNPESKPSTSKNVLCDVCWKELNTQAMLDCHSQSPAHLKIVKDRLLIQKLKEDYRQLRESQAAK